MDISYGVLTFLLLLLAIPGALYFGNDGATLVTLNFTKWTGKDFTGQNYQLYA